MLAAVLAVALAGLMATGCATTSAQSCCPAAKSCCMKASCKKLIAAKITLKADKADAFIEVVKPLIAASRAEPGCISYTLYQNPHEKTAFFFFEEWKDQAAIDFHFATPHFKAVGDQIKDMIVGAPEIVIFNACAAPQAK
jgi:quinol monooxygenase YgiN